jgi:hypothetical protein
MGQFVPSWIQKLRPFGKPCLFAEFGLVNERWGPSPLADKDAEGVHLHNGLWSAMMSGAAGTAMLWWWDSYVDPQNLYWQFRNVAAFARGVPWTTAGFEPVGGESSDPHLRVLGLRGRKLVLLWLQNKQHTWWNVVNGVKVPEIPEGTARVAGVANGSWQAEWWDTWQGKAIRSETVTVVGNNLALTVKQLTRDVAVKLKHME